jgi:hypothetical protein
MEEGFIPHVVEIKGNGQPYLLVNFEVNEGPRAQEGSSLLAMKSRAEDGQDSNREIMKVGCRSMQPNSHIWAWTRQLWKFRAGRVDSGYARNRACKDILMQEFLEPSAFLHHCLRTLGLARSHTSLAVLCCPCVLVLRLLSDNANRAVGTTQWLKYM